MGVCVGGNLPQSLAASQPDCGSHSYNTSCKRELGNDLIIFLNFCVCLCSKNSVSFCKLYCGSSFLKTIWNQYSLKSFQAISNFDHIITGYVTFFSEKIYQMYLLFLWCSYRDINTQICFFFVLNISPMFVSGSPPVEVWLLQDGVLFILPQLHVHLFTGIEVIQSDDRHFRGCGCRLLRLGRPRPNGLLL